MQIVDVRNQLARHPTKEYSKRPLDAIKYIIIHHSATKEGDAFSFARYHVNNRDWPGIGYHYVILEDGTVQRANDLTTVSYHISGYNSTAVGICLVGNFTEEILQFDQKEALKELCLYLLTKLGLSVASIKGHNELTGHTICPAVDMEALRGYIERKEVEIFLDNDKLNVPALLINNTTFVAIRPLAEILGYRVTWDSKYYRVYLENCDEFVKLKEERDHYYSIIQKIKNLLAGE